MTGLQSRLAIKSMMALSISLPIAASGSGELDPTFGTNGVVITDVVNEWGEAIAIQPDGKIVVAGEINTGTATNKDILLVRYESDGSIDTTFGTDGMVSTDINQSVDSTTAIFIQSDGKIVVSGHTPVNTPPYSSGFLLRYDSEGNLDDAFGANGMVTCACEFLNDVFAQSDGKLIATGGNRIMRFESTGVPDNGFGTAGVVELATGGEMLSLSELILQADGKILVGGTKSYTATEPFDVNFLLARIESDGTTDIAFGSAGIAEWDFNGYYDWLNALAILSDGKIIAGGQGNPGTGSSELTLARYTTDGSLDPTFDSGGFVHLSDDPNSVFITDIAPLADGRLLALTRISYESSFMTYRLARFEADGQLDTTFGNQGFVDPPSTPFAERNAWAMAMQPDHKAVLAGGYESGVYSDVLVARYKNVVSTQVFGNGFELAPVD